MSSVAGTARDGARDGVKTAVDMFSKVIKIKPYFRLPSNTTRQWSV